MSSKTALLLSSVLGLVLGTACSSPVDEEPSASSEDALTSLPSTGTFAIEDRPLSGSYVARLTLSAGKKFEIEYVRRTQSSEPWAWNPWLRVPTTHEETLVLRGTWFTFAGDHGSTQASFDVTDGNGADEHFIFEVASASSAGIKLKTIDGTTFDLRASSSQGGGASSGGASIKRVIRCDGMQITAVITLDEAQRRRGTIAIKRKPNADNNAPPNKTTTVVYTGDTGVADYMGYEGRDSAGNGYDFALKASDLEKTSGPIANVGLGFSPNDWLAGGAYHNSLTCTIGTR